MFKYFNFYIYLFNYVFQFLLQLVKKDLHRSRDRLMWVLLQYISGSIQRNSVSVYTLYQTSLTLSSNLLNTTVGMFDVYLTLCYDSGCGLTRSK